MSPQHKSLSSGGRSRNSTRRLRQLDQVNGSGPSPEGRSQAELMNLDGQTELEITIVRPPLVYGPKVRGNLRGLEQTLLRLRRESP